MVEPSPPSDGSTFEENYTETMGLSEGPLYDLAAASAWVTASIPGDHPPEKLADLGQVLVTGAAWIRDIATGAADLDKDAFQLRLDQAEDVLRRAAENGSERAAGMLQDVRDAQEQFARYRAQDDMLENAMRDLESQREPAVVDREELVQEPPPSDLPPEKKRRRWFR